MTDTITLTDLEMRFLRVAAGQAAEISREEWTSGFMWPAQAKLEAAGLIYKTFEDDQPTSYATEKGEAFLAAQVATEKLDEGASDLRDYLFKPRDRSDPLAACRPMARIYGRGDDRYR